MDIIANAKISRAVTLDDIEKLSFDAPFMVEELNKQHGRYPGGYALAHCQVEKDDPLRFFVMHDGRIIINPVVLNHTKYMKPEKEGCLSYPLTPEGNPLRWRMGDVEYESLIMGALVKTKIKVDGKLAHIFQHEIDHMEGKNVYGN